MSNLNSKTIDATEISILKQSIFFRAFSFLFRPSVRQAVVVIADQGFYSITSFIAGVLIARACSQTEYGLYVMAISATFFLGGIQNSLISKPYTIRYPSYTSEQRASYLVATFVHQVLLCGLIAVGLIVTALVIRFTGRSQEARILLIFIPVAVALMMRDFLRYIQLAALHVWWNLFVSSSTSILTLIWLGTAFVAGRLSLSIAFAGLAVGMGVPTLIASVIYLRKGRLDKRLLWNEFLSNWHLGKWLLGETLAYNFSFRSYPFLLSLLGGMEKAAIFGVCLTLSHILNPLFVGIVAYLRPRSAHIAVENPARLKRLIFQIIGLLAIPLSGILLATLLAGDWILLKVYGPSYGDFGVELFVVMLAMSISVIINPLAVGVEAMQHTNVVFQGRLIGVVVILIIGVPAVYFTGVLGAAVSLAIAGILNSLFLYYRFNRMLRGQPDDLHITCEQGGAEPCSRQGE